MKLSTIQWLSKPIVLPLLMGVLNLAPVSAEQMDRSRATNLESLPAVTDLNLAVPVTASPLPSEAPEPGSSLEPIWSNPANPGRKNPAPGTNRSKTGSRAAAASNSDTAAGNTSKDSRRSRSGSRKDLAAISKPPLSGNYLRLVRDPDNGTNDVGNPIYILEAYVGGERYQTFTAVSGTARSQNYNRNRGNNSAPLPDGSYSVSSQIADGTAYEVGRTFVGIYPEFKTDRTDLGIHLDRSFNQTNGYDGTAGCIGIATVAERDAINEFVAKYRPHNLFVRIAS